MTLLPNGSDRDALPAIHAAIRELQVEYDNIEKEVACCKYGDNVMTLKTKIREVEVHLEDAIQPAAISRIGNNLDRLCDKLRRLESNPPAYKSRLKWVANQITELEVYLF